MKLRLLKEKLNTLGKEFDDCEVILQVDSEGNGYNPLYCVDENCVYLPDDGGQVYSLDWSADDACMEEEEWEEFKKKKKAIVLAP